MAQSLVTSTLQDTSQAATAATRHLCAGTFLDREFRDLLLGQVRHNAARRVSPSYGFDLVPVASQAWRSWWLETTGQAFILALLVIAIAVDFSAVITAICASGIWYLGSLMLRHAPETARLHVKSTSARWLRRSLRVGERERHRELSRLLGVSAGGCAVLIVIGEFSATSGGSLAHGVFAAAVLMLLLEAAAAVIGAAHQTALNRTCSAGSLRPARLGRRLAMIDQQQWCDYVVYRRPSPDDGDPGHVFPGWDHEPTRFIGSGTLVHRWLPPLGVQLLRPGEGSMPDREYPSPPFASHELVEHLKNTMKQVGDGGDPTRLRGFDVRDRLYIAETEVGTERGFLQRRCPLAEVSRIIDDPHDTARHYLEIRVSSEGEVVTTVFLRVTIRGRTLSLDFSACALTRTPLAFQVLEQYAETGAGAVLRAAVRGVGSLPQSLAGLWRLGLAPWVLIRSAWAVRDRTITPRRGLMIGSRVSVREEIAEDWDDADLDKITIYDEMKIVEQRLLKATEDFLEARKVDTSIFRRRVFSIINTGVLNMGKLEMNQSAVGPGAQVRFGGTNPEPSDEQQHAPDGATQ
jgi:hypothetical protein